MFKSGNAAKNSGGDKSGFKKPNFTIKTKPRKGFEVTDKNGRELAEEIWSKYEMSERQLPRFEDFARIAKLPIEKIEQAKIPKKQPWKQFNHEWKLRLAQAAQIFSQKWVDAIKIHKRESDLLKLIGMTKSQVSMMIRNNRDTMSRHYQPGSRRNQIESFASCMELVVTSIALSKPEDSKRLTFSEILEKMTDLGNYWDRRQLAWDFSKGEADWELLMINALALAPVMLSCEKWPAAMPYISRTSPQSVMFKRSLAFTVQELQIRIDGDAFEFSEVRDLASFHNSVTVSQSSRGYVLYTIMSRIMREAGNRSKDSKWDTLPFDLVKKIYTEKPRSNHIATCHDQADRYFVENYNSETGYGSQDGYGDTSTNDMYTFCDYYTGVSDEQVQWENLVGRVCKGKYWRKCKDLMNCEEIKQNKKSNYSAVYPKSHEKYGQTETHEIPANLSFETMRVWLEAHEKGELVDGKSVSQTFLEEMMRRFEIMAHARQRGTAGRLWADLRREFRVKQIPHKHSDRNPPFIWKFKELSPNRVRSEYSSSSESDLDEFEVINVDIENDAAVDWSMDENDEKLEKIKKQAETEAIEVAKTLSVVEADEFEPKTVTEKAIPKLQRGVKVTGEEITNSDVLFAVLNQTGGEPVEWASE